MNEIMSLLMTTNLHSSQGDRILKFYLPNPHKYPISQVKKLRPREGKGFAKSLS